MAKQDARKQFVQARLKALGGDPTPEKRAKLRQRFNKLSETKEGRTRIAQVILPDGTPEQRKALKQSLRPTKTSTTGSTGSTTGGSTTGGSTTGSSTKVDLTGVRDATPYIPTVISDGTTAKNNSESSAAIPKPNVYGDTWEEKVALKLEQWNVPVFGRVAGIGRAYDENKTSTVIQKSAAAFLEAAVTGALLGTNQAGRKTNKLSPSTNPPTNPFSTQKVTQFDPSRMRQALESYNKPGTPFKSNVSGANRPTSMPVTPDFKAKPTPEFIPGGVDRYPAFKNPPGTKSPARSKPTKETKGGKSTATTVPATTIPATTIPATTIPATTVPRPVTTTVPSPTATSIPKSTTPTTVVAGKPGSVYDQLGTRISGSYKDPKPGDPMPTKPQMPRGLSKKDKEAWQKSDAMEEYNDALYAWQKFNKKK